MNDTLITVWVISEENGVIVGAHCLGCKAGLAESCSHIACALFYLESWTKIHGKLACTQMKCQWILPPFVKDVEYARVRDINFKSAKKLKSELDKSIENLINDDCKTFCKEKRTSLVKDKLIPVPTQGDMDTLFNDLSKCKIKPVILSLVEPYAESYIKSSRHITTVTNSALCIKTLSWIVNPRSAITKSPGKSLFSIPQVSVRYLSEVLPPQA